MAKDPDVEAEGQTGEEGEEEDGAAGDDTVMEEQFAGR